jgi:plastocyanin
VKNTLFFNAGLFISLLLSGAAQADEYVIQIKDNQFSPATLTIPADQKVRVIVRNLDPTPAEFESFDLRREKVISGGSEAVLFIGPLKSGNYTFFDEFHADTAKGTIIVK